uniref:Osteoclast stimulatory transmembrane protein n=1 Tax=Hippocampus comes TaxID=109280 RepID=A0A3Q2YR81_HIPCM
MNRTACCRESVKSLVFYLWDVYSSAKPLGRHLWTLTALCLTLAVVTGTLLYHWLSKTLKYDHNTSAHTALVYGVAMLPTTFLCHPLRCVLTMTLPTVCTKQGRKLLISAAVMILMCNVIPNISVNVGAVLRTLKCTADGFSKTLLNSSELLNTARQDMVKEAIQVRKEDLMEINFSYMRKMITQYKLLSNRILAALFVALLIWESARYLKSYLTSITFDNNPISKRLRQNEAHVTTRRSVPIRGRFQISSGECTPSVISLLVVTLYFTAIALIAALDHIVYHTVQVILPWLLDFPAMSASINVQWFPPAFCILPHACITRAGVSALLACLWLMSYLLLFLEAYATRLRRNICASFFKKQEERRVAFWNAKAFDVAMVTDTSNAHATPVAFRKPGRFNITIMAGYRNII